MQAGDVVVCVNANGYRFTEGKKYTVLKYELPEPSSLAGFTWPAYVTIEDDRGRKVVCHPHRFIRY